MGTTAHLWTVALLFLLTTNTGLSQRSGKTITHRNLPVGADVKKDSGFECPEEFGYYPHPADCSQYYVCVFGGALLESCTGGLMYSNELQTCDWPRNVGCEIPAVVEQERPREQPNRQQQQVQELATRSRFSVVSHQPSPSPSPTHPPPPPPPSRVQPNPVITSRGHPRPLEHEEIVKQQLYAEVEELPPAEEIENDRQQRVYRGQPQTVGEVQRDRDGYAVPQLPSGRSINANIIPSSITNNNGKVGAFSFGTQVEPQKQTPQPFTMNRRDKDDNVNILKDDSKDNKHAKIKRNKRSLTEKTTHTNESITADENIDRKGNSFKADDLTDRNKRQTRFHRYHGPGASHLMTDTGVKNWVTGKPAPNNEYFSTTQRPYSRKKYPESFKPSAQIGDTFTPVLQSGRFYDSSAFGNFKPYVPDDDNLKYSTSGVASTYTEPPSYSYFNLNGITSTLKIQLSTTPSPFSSFFSNHSPKPTPGYVTKSPPISLLASNSNPFSTLAGGFYNNQPQQVLNKQPLNSDFRDSYQNPIKQASLQDFKGLGQYYDPTEVSPSVVTVRPIKIRNTTPAAPRIKYRIKPQGSTIVNIQHNPTPTQPEPTQNDEHNEESSSSEEQSDDNAPDFPDPPEYFTNHRNKYEDIQNPFADPNFDFDSFIAKVRNTHLSHVDPAKVKKLNSHAHAQAPAHPHAQAHAHPHAQAHAHSPAKTKSPYRLVTTIRTVSKGRPNKPTHFIKAHHNYAGMSTPRPFSMSAKSYATRPIVSFTTLRPTNAVHHDSAEKPQYEYYGSDEYYEDYEQSTEKLNNNAHQSSTPYFNKNKPVSYTLKPVQYHKEVNIGSDRLPKALANVTKYNNYDKRPYNSITPTEYRPAKYYNDVVSTIETKTEHLKKKLQPAPTTTTEQPEYYYDEDDEYYYEPPVKSQFMPISEVKPQRPPIAQNYEEYEDYESSEEEEEETSTTRPTVASTINTKTPIRHTTYRNKIKMYANMTTERTPYSEAITELKSTKSTLRRPEIANYHVNHSPRKPYTKSNNQTTLRPYTMHHRLQKPASTMSSHTTPFESVPDPTKASRGSHRWNDKPTEIDATAKHPTIQTQTVFKHDNVNQETRDAQTEHDDNFSNSLEPAVTSSPSTFTRSRNPTFVSGRALYNGSQQYDPQQFDSFYALYDDDVELYKDNDYGHQYTQRPSPVTVQQTYRGTPPPTAVPVAPVISTRPVPVRTTSHIDYTPRPAIQDDYEDALIAGQIDEQNQYRQPVRQPTREEGNELEYEHRNPGAIGFSTVRAPLRNTLFLTAPPTTTTTTARPPPSSAQPLPKQPLRSTTDESFKSNLNTPLVESQTANAVTETTTAPFPFNVSDLAKPFSKPLTLDKGDIQPVTSSNNNLTETTSSPTLTSSNISDKLHNVDANATPPSVTTGFSFRHNPTGADGSFTLTHIRRPIEEVTSTTTVKTTEKTIVPIYQRPQIEKARKINDYLRYDIFSSQKAPKFYLKTVIKRPAPFTAHNVSNDDSAISFSQIVSQTPSEINKLNETSTNKPEESFYKKGVNSNRRQYLKDLFVTKYDSLQTTVSPYKSLENIRRDEGEFDVTTEMNYMSKEITSKIKYAYKSATPEITSEIKYAPKFPTPEITSEIKYAPKFPNPDITSETKYAPKLQTPIITSEVKYAPKFTTPEITTEIKYAPKFATPSKQPLYYRFFTTSEPDLEIRNVTEAYLSPSVYNTDKTTVEPILIAKPTKQYFPKLDRYDFKEEVEVVNINHHKSKFEEVPKDEYKKAEKNIALDHSPRYRKIEEYDIYATPIPHNIDISTPLNDLGNLFSRYDIFSRRTTTTAPFFIPTPKLVVNDTISNIVEKEEVNPHLVGGFLTNFDNATDGSQDDNPAVQNIEITTTADTETTVSTVMTTTTTTTTTAPPQYPTRKSRVNAAMKSIAKLSGGVRRSYQSSKCGTENNNDPNCNEIKITRNNHRGRGSAHYSTLSNDQVNRGTPPSRIRPTLKPSTSIVSKAQEFVDIYRSPPTRPPSVYPTPTPDKTAAKCRKDVCLLPDCSCGGRDVPGDLPVEQVPQIVLLTFDDSVNDLNKVLYADLFEKGRVNPNGCPISATFYVSHEWTDYSQVQNLYSGGHEMASHTISHSFGEQFSQKKWNREVSGQREILAAYGGVKLSDVRGMRAPFLSVGGNKMFKMLYDSNFTYDSSMPVYENRPPSWPYTLDYKLFHDCMIPPCPTRSYPGVWEVPMVMWQDLNGGRCSMADACSNPPNAEGVYKMILKNFDRHYTTNRAPFGLYYHAAWFTQPHHKEGFIMFLDAINRMQDVYIVTNWQALQWVRDPTPLSRMNSFQPFHCDYKDRPKRCNNPKVCNLWHKSGVRYMRTCQPCPDIYPWTGRTGIQSSKIDNDIED